MIDWKNEEFIEMILRKLCQGVKLDEYEIECVSAALRKANDITQEPYYEVVYHDEYNRTEHRIMNPVDSKSVDHGDYISQRDRFEVNFNRCIPKRSRQINNDSLIEPTKSKEDIFVEMLGSIKHIASSNLIAMLVEGEIQRKGPFSRENGEKVRKILEESREGEDAAEGKK